MKLSFFVRNGCNVELKLSCGSQTTASFATICVPIADGLVVAPDFDTDALSWTEYIRHYGLVEGRTFASTKYVFKKNRRE